MSQHTHRNHRKCSNGNCFAFLSAKFPVYSIKVSPCQESTKAKIDNVKWNWKILGIFFMQKCLKGKKRFSFPKNVSICTLKPFRRWEISLLLSSLTAFMVQRTLYDSYQNLRSQSFYTHGWFSTFFRQWKFTAIPGLFFDLWRRFFILASKTALNFYGVTHRIRIDSFSPISFKEVHVVSTQWTQNTAFNAKAGVQWMSKSGWRRKSHNRRKHEAK